MNELFSHPLSSTPQMSSSDSVFTLDIPMSVSRGTSSAFFASLWEQHYMDMLNEILTSGRVRSKYKHSVVGRIGQTFMLSICTGTMFMFCLPCVLLDFGAACFKKVKPESVRFVAATCNDIYEDIRMKDLSNIKMTDLTKSVIMRVILKYLQAFDACIAEKTETGARRANIIRGELVNIISHYGPGAKYVMLRDDGDMSKLREIIVRLPYEYISYGIV